MKQTKKGVELYVLTEDSTNTMIACFYDIAILRKYVEKYFPQYEMRNSFGYIYNDPTHKQEPRLLDIDTVELIQDVIPYD